jgi:Alpha/beta hydrolase domain
MKTPTYLLTPAVLVAAFALADDQRVTVPVPTVTGPVAWIAQPPDAAHGYTFNHTFLDLAHAGYVEEEFFLEGTANRYNMPAEATGSVMDSGHPYKTRIVVRRPTSARKFNGTVIVEWTNVTGSRDLEMDWFQSSEHFIRAGYAWVGVSAQHVGVDALKVWSPARYGTLDVTEGGKITKDELSYDIMAATAEVVRGKAKSNVMGGLKVERVIASGHSQSAGRLAGYVNSVYPLNPVFDGVMLHGGGGKIRTDLNVKVWKMLSETDVRGPAARQDDTGNFRTWEVAGTSHVDSESAKHFAEIARLNASAAANGVGAGQCDKPTYSQVPFRYVFDSAYDHMVEWIKNGTPPPSAPPIQFTDAKPPAIARDANGIALGGIRLAEEAVPTAVNTGQNSGAGFCRLYGSHVDFDKDKLATLYPSHKEYVAAVKDVTGKNLKAGYILKPDAEATIAAAERSDIGGR